MAPPEHILLGISVANIYQSIQSFFKKDLHPYSKILVLSVLFALLPDMDSFSGNYTSTNVFIGHRGITHSIFFVTASSLIFSAFLFFLDIKQLKGAGTEHRKRFPLFMFLVLLTAGMSHIIADLPQPASIWGGIPVFFPLKSDGVYMRSGGWARIGWYDLKIIWSLIYAALLSWILIALIHVLKKRQRLFAIRAAAIAVILINIITCVNITLYISNSTYTSNEAWNAQQEQYLKSSSPLVQCITESGKTIALKLFYLIRH